MEKISVLFLCTGNSCRSQMAEAITNQLFGEKLHAFSAGSNPKLDLYPETDGVHPRTLETLKRNLIRTDRLHAKNWDSFVNGTITIDFAITLCSDALNEMEESCPVFPGKPISAHWGVIDPVKATGDEETINRVFQDAFLIIKRRIELFSCLPIEGIDRTVIQKQMNEIGKTA